MHPFLEFARSTDLYRALCAREAGGDGNLLERTDESTAAAQTEFLRWAFQQAAPQVVLETGTNKGLFAYLLSLIGHGLTLHTFDCDPRSAEAMSLLNRSQKNVHAHFYAGDSRETLRAFSERVDFAWIDGGHDWSIALSDLMHCYRLRIPFVAVDDTAFTSVTEAVAYLRQHTPYELIENPFRKQDRRGALLLRLPEESANGKAPSAESSSGVHTLQVS